MPQDDPDLIFVIDTENVTIPHQYNLPACAKCYKSLQNQTLQIMVIQAFPRYLQFKVDLIIVVNKLTIMYRGGDLPITLLHQ